MRYTSIVEQQRRKVGSVMREADRLSEENERLRAELKAMASIILRALEGHHD